MHIGKEVSRELGGEEDKDRTPYRKRESRWCDVCGISVRELPIVGQPKEVRGSEHIHGNETHITLTTSRVGKELAP